jgi:hypothetical protein
MFNMSNETDTFPQIVSKSDLFRGEMVNKPKPCKTIYDSMGEPLYICPSCGNCANSDNCGVVGAEPGCLFCNQCNTEFEVS